MAIEFALILPPLLLMLIGTMELARLTWTEQAMQLAGDQTARCVALGSATCATPATYAMSAATNYGAGGLAATGVHVDNKPPTVTNATACSPPSGNTLVRVQLSVPFSSPFSGLIPMLSQTLTTTSCFPWTGK